MTSHSEIIHILLAVALRPEDCQSRDAQGKLIDFPAHLDDPLQVSATTISQQALVLLRAWLAPDGLAVLQALPGYVEASPFELTGHLNAGDKPPDPDQSRTLGRRIKGRSLRTSGGRRGRLSANGANASDEDVDLDDDSLIRQAAARVAACENIWEVLAGQALKKPYRGDEAHPLAPRGGSLLSVLLDAWELDAQQNKDAGEFPLGPGRAGDRHRCWAKMGGGSLFSLFFKRMVSPSTSTVQPQTLARTTQNHARGSVRHHLCALPIPSFNADQHGSAIRVAVRSTPAIGPSSS